MFNKRGISPLIATVLIIGFTVALAAMIITWGTSFTRNIQEETEASANIQLTCATEVDFSIIAACDDGLNVLDVTVTNNAEKAIDSFTLRAFRSASAVDVVAITTAIPAFGTALFDNVAVTSEPIKKVELIPTVTIAGKSITCSGNVRSLGDLDSNLLAC